MKNNITFEEFVKAADVLSIQMGEISKVERIPKNKKMIMMVVNFGNEINKTVVSNIGGNMEDVTELIGRSFPFVTNLEPVERNGFISEAMILVEIEDGKLNLNLNKGYKIL